MGKMGKDCCGIKNKLHCRTTESCVGIAGEDVPCDHGGRLQRSWEKNSCGAGVKQNEVGALDSTRQFQRWRMQRRTVYDRTLEHKELGLQEGGITYNIRCTVNPNGSSHTKTLWDPTNDIAGLF